MKIKQSREMKKKSAEYKLKVCEDLYMISQFKIRP